MKHLGDITKINGAEIPAVDCITGGSPCQDLSVAGKRAGLDGERSGLFMEQIRIVKEMRAKEIRKHGRTANTKCRFLVWENVVGAMSSPGIKNGVDMRGKDFQAVLTEIVRIVEADAPDVPMPDKGKWTKAGCLYGKMGNWSIAWRVHDAQFWGVPQRRKRIALVADFGGLSAPEVLFERKGMSWDSEPCGAERKGTAEAVGNGVESASVGVDLYNQSITNDIAATLSANSCETATRSGPSVLQSAEPILLESNQNHATIQTDGISTALPASMGMGGGYVPMVTQSASVGVDAYNQTTTGGVSKSLNSAATDSDHIPCVLQSAVYDARGNGNGEIAPTMTGDHQNRVTDYTALAMNTSTVRRLTPLECERLQGFPDGWTGIGEWTDTKGKKHQTADSARYKALGNSIALPFWFYLLRRISAQYERPATLGSLFDGIGGFPLCWERCNGQGTAIWASEIEEFPIAVTKRHFPERGDAE